jgi:hypothetical protein
VCKAVGRSTQSSGKYGDTKQTLASRSDGSFRERECRPCMQIEPTKTDLVARIA